MKYKLKWKIGICVINISYFNYADKSNIVLTIYTWAN